MSDAWRIDRFNPDAVDCDPLAGIGFVIQPRLIVVCQHQSHLNMPLRAELLDAVRL